jgi:hypothetical protein
MSSKPPAQSHKKKHLTSSTQPSFTHQPPTTSDTHNNTNYSYIQDEQAALIPTAVSLPDPPVPQLTPYADYPNSNSQVSTQGYLPIDTTLDLAMPPTEADHNCDMRAIPIPITVTSLDPFLDEPQPTQLLLLLLEHPLESTSIIQSDTQISAKILPEADSKPNVPEVLKDEDSQDPQDKEKDEDKARDKKKAPDKKKKIRYTHIPPLRTLNAEPEGIFHDDTGNAQFVPDPG